MYEEELGYPEYALSVLFAIVVIAILLFVGR